MMSTEDIKWLMKEIYDFNKKCDKMSYEELIECLKDTIESERVLSDDLVIHETNLYNIHKEIRRRIEKDKTGRIEKEVREIFGEEGYKSLYD